MATEKKQRAPKKPRADGKKIKKFFDDNENAVISTEDERTITIQLKLRSEKRRRLIGVVTKSTCVFNVVRKRDKHLHLASMSYGFNYKIIEMAKRFHTIVLTDEDGRYKIPRSFILENPNFIYFKQQGFELQTFVSLAQLEQFRVPSPF